MDRTRGTGLIDPVIDPVMALPADGTEIPGCEPGGDPVKALLLYMDRLGVERGVIPVDLDDETARRALREHPDRLAGRAQIDPGVVTPARRRRWGGEGAGVMDEVRRLVALHETLGVVAASACPAACVPPVPIDDKRFFPLYAKCVELRLPVFVSCGVPRARAPMACQHVERVDEVCAHFPELAFVMCDGAEPWVELAVHLLAKWPRLHYATSELAPADYPEAVLRYANGPGADKVLYASGFPTGPSWERIFAELPDLPLRDDVRPRLLGENARRLLRL